jgi:uncharacterized membrane protein
MMAGVYTGGTPNLAAIKSMLGVPNELYLVVHSYDMVVSLLYLAFVLSAGVRISRALLPRRGKVVEDSTENRAGDAVGGGGRSLPLAGALALAVMVLAIGGGVSLLFPGEAQTVVAILVITTLGIAASFAGRVRRARGSHEAGMYLVYVFSIVVASMVDVTRLDIAGGLPLLFYMGFVVFGSLLLQMALSRVVGIDGDTVLVSSVALVNSPPFVPLVSAATGNKGIIITGLTVGLVGYAIGNYLGYIIYLVF